MKAVFLTSISGNGGSASTAFHNAKVLQRAGWETTLFAPGTYWSERGRREGVRVDASLELRRGFHPLSFARDLERFRNYLIRTGTDVVVVQKSPEQWLAAFTLATLNRRIGLVRLRGVVFAIKPSAFNRWIHHRMDAVVCSASAIAQQFAMLPGFRTDHVTTLLEGVDTERFAPASAEERAAARQQFGLPTDALIVGTAGRPSPVKGHDLLVRAFAKALAEMPAAALEKQNPRLCIFSDEGRRGPGSYTDLAALCAELKIEARVDLRPGHLDDMRAVYRALDAYALPSRGSEGSSRAGLEACASGLPVLASRVGVLPDLLIDEKTGRLFPANDEAALAGALRELILTWPTARELGKAARARMVAEFREDVYAAKLGDILGQTVHTKARRHEDTK